MRKESHARRKKISYNFIKNILAAVLPDIFQHCSYPYHHQCRHSNVNTILKNYSLGTSRVNEPMHAVLEGELAESAMVQGKEAQNVRNRALLHYLASLANSNSTEDKFDFDFVESLLKNGADVNSTDKTGQTVFHEVARSWNCDVASFLIKNGKNDTVGHSTYITRILNPS